jgi:predicted nucleic acid-binding protein
VSLYIDTSCILKLLFPEPETDRVMQLVAAEEHVVVSSLARLEAIVQIHARCIGGVLRRPAAQQLIGRLDVILRQAPYELVPAPSRIIDDAEVHVRRLPRDGYCPTLDRLHLAVMKGLDLGRLLTNDDAQVRAARGLGFEVLLPRSP